MLATSNQTFMNVLAEDLKRLRRGTGLSVDAVAKCPALLGLFPSAAEAHEYIERWCQKVWELDTRGRLNADQALANAYAYAYPPGNEVDLTSRRAKLSSIFALSTRTIINYEDAGIKRLMTSSLGLGDKIDNSDLNKIIESIIRERLIAHDPRLSSLFEVDSLFQAQRKIQEEIKVRFDEARELDSQADELLLQIRNLENQRFEMLDRRMELGEEVDRLNTQINNLNKEISKHDPRRKAD